MKAHAELPLLTKPHTYYKVRAVKTKDSSREGMKVELSVSKLML